MVFTINSSLHDSMNSVEDITIVPQPSAHYQESGHILKFQGVNAAASIQMYALYIPGIHVRLNHKLCSSIHGHYIPGTLQ